MDQWTEIRKKILVEGVSKRQVMEEEGIHWETLQKILAHSEPPGYQMSRERPQPKVGPFLGRIKQILEDDKHTHKKLTFIRSPHFFVLKLVIIRLEGFGRRGGCLITRDTSLLKFITGNFR